MPVSASLWAVSAAVRIASLNLCTDEYLLLAADRHQIASVTRLAADRDDSPLWRAAAGLPTNRGQLEDVIGQRPTVLLTMGGGGRSTATLARKLGIRVVNLPYPLSISNVEANMAKVAQLTGQSERFERWRARLSILRSRRLTPVASAFLGQGGLTFGQESLGAEWMALGGYRQVEVVGGRFSAETMIVRPPSVLLKSDYRHRQLSRGNQWLDQPWVRRSGARTIVTDGRPWTCTGPLMPYEIGRLQALR